MVVVGHTAARLYARQLRFHLGRSFSTSSVCRKNGPLATFPPTSSRKIDAIVKTFRETVFFPNHLPKHEQEMIHRPSKQFYLTGEEPVKTSVPVVPAVLGVKSQKRSAKDPPREKDDKDEKKIPRATAPPIYPRKKATPPRETFIMNPISIVRDTPKLRYNYNRMLKLMSSPSDFAILPGFLREVNLSRMNVSPDMLARTIRRAAELDCVDVMMRTFQSLDTIGLRVNHPEIITQLTQAIVRHAANGYWTQERLDKALAYFDSVLLMLQNPQHRMIDASEKFVDALQLPTLWGAVMALGSIRQLRYGPRETLPHRYDLRAVVQGFVDRLDLSEVGNDTSPGSVQNMWLANWAPAIVGTKYAIQALGSADSAAMKLQLALPVMDEAAAKAAAKVTEAYTDGSLERLGPQMVRIMEAALDAKAPPESLVEEAVMIQSDGEAAGTEEIIVEVPEEPTEKKDTA